MSKPFGTLVLSRAVDEVIMIDDIPLKVSAFNKHQRAWVALEMEGRVEQLYVLDQTTFTNVKITFVGVRKGKARLAIKAPPEVKVYRQEVYDRIRDEGR